MHRRLTVCVWVCVFVCFFFFILELKSRRHIHKISLISFNMKSGIELVVVAIFVRIRTYHHNLTVAFNSYPWMTFEIFPFDFLVGWLICWFVCLHSGWMDDLGEFNWIGWNKCCLTDILRLQWKWWETTTLITMHGINTNMAYGFS